MAAMSMMACGDGGSQPGAKVDDANNPLLEEKFGTPFEVPPFDKIKDEHFVPAINKGIELAKNEINAIIESTDTPTFENTVVALEKAGRILGRTATIFYNLNSANSSESMQEIAKEIAPMLSAHSDDIYLNEKLFAKVKEVHDKRESLELNPEQIMLVEKQYKAFVRSGANLDAEKKERLREINKKLSVLTLKFGENGVNEVNQYKLVIKNKEDLSGLPDNLIEAAKSKDEKDTWVFTLSNPSLMPFLQYADNRALRKEIWEAYQAKGSKDEFDNSANIIEITDLRQEKATLLGYASHAHYVLEENMAKTPAKVYELLDQLWKPAVAKAKEEEANIKKMMEADGIQDAVQPYDWRYYTEKIRKKDFDLDEQAIKPYFSLEAVQAGIFDLCKTLFGLEFKQLTNLPKYHEDVTTWEVTEADGTHVGILYMDFHPRNFKKPGAWMTSYRKQETVDGERKAPVISIVCNFTPPTGNDPALLTFDEATTFFHEFGHALHGLLSNVEYYSLSGTSVARDFVELPSQILENWAADPLMMVKYAKHYKTGEPIPDSLIQKLENAGTFDQGFATVEYLAASYLDLDYHSGKEKVTDVAAFEKKSMDKIGLSSAIIPRYKSGYFNHIFAGGYSAGYYSYIWSGVLDTDAYDAFKSTGDIFNKEKAKSFRENILEKGGTVEPMELYKRFRGKEPSIQPLLRKRGLDKPMNVAPVTS